MGAVLKFLALLLELLTGKRRTADDVADEARDSVADTTLDDDVDTLRDGLRNDDT